MRGLEHLHPAVRAKAEELKKLCASQALPLLITDTFRTQAEQTALYAKGRTDKSSAVVTNCQYPNSPHNWGVAFDFARSDNPINPKTGKKDAYYEGDAIGKIFFKSVGTLAKSIGLFWGGDFKSFVDKPHLEMPEYLPSNSTKTLIAKYGTPEKFKAAWGAAAASVPTPPSGHPSKEGNRPTLRKGSKGGHVETLQTALNSKGFSCGAIDGDFGAKTEAAVKAFQGYNGLVKDGIVGAKTWGKLGL